MFMGQNWVQEGLVDMRPTKHRLVVEVLEVEGLSERGLLLPDTVSEWIPPTQGRVVAIGSGVGKTRVGEKVLYGLGAGTEYRGLLVLHENDIICGMD